MIQGETFPSLKVVFQQEKVAAAVWQLGGQCHRIHEEHLLHYLFDTPIFQEELLLPEDY